MCSCQLNLDGQTSLRCLQCNSRTTILKCDVLDDGEAKSSTSKTTGAPFIDSVKTFKKVGQMFCRDTCSIVYKCESVKVACSLCLNTEVSSTGGISENIAENVAE